MIQTTSTANRIILSFEHPGLEQYARQFCSQLMPDLPIQTVPMAQFFERSEQSGSPDELLVISVAADANGCLPEGSPLVQQLLAARSPVLVLRQPSGATMPQTDFERVVVPLDGSAIAGQAIPIASKVARMKNLPVKFVMVIDPSRVIPPAYTYDPEAWGVIEELRTTAHWALSQAETMMANDGIPVSSDLILGSINASLMASMDDTDLVVMTTHGPGTRNLRYRESVARRVLISTSQPVLIMQGEPQQPVVVAAHGTTNTTWIEPLKRSPARIA